jgi:hypothetical protein
MTNWFRGMIADGHNGSVSSKRVVTLLAFMFCSIAFFANMFFGKHIDQFIYETMAYIAMAGLGVTVAEKFSSKPQSTPPTILKPPADPPVRNTRND